MTPYTLNNLISDLADLRAPDKASLDVEGSGSATGVPDVATVSLGVSCEAKSAKLAQRQNTAIAARIRAALVAFVPDENIQTRNYNVGSNDVRDRDGKLTGEVVYSVSNTVTVRTEQTSQLGRIIDAALDNGANSVHGLEFSMKDNRELREQALAAATADARRQAESVAKALGKRILGLCHVEADVSEESSGSFDRCCAPTWRGAVTPIDPGALSVVATVKITFNLEA